MSRTCLGRCISRSREARARPHWTLKCWSRGFHGRDSTKAPVPQTQQRTAVPAPKQSPARGQQPAPPPASQLLLCFLSRSAQVKLGTRLSLFFPKGCICLWSAGCDVSSPQCVGSPHWGARAPECRLSTCGLVIPPHVRSPLSDLGSNPRPLRWKADSSPLDEQGSSPFLSCSPCLPRRDGAEGPRTGGEHGDFQEPQRPGSFRNTPGGVTRGAATATERPAALLSTSPQPWSREVPEGALSPAPRRPSCPRRTSTLLPILGPETLSGNRCCCLNPPVVG